jgi:hemolysin III
MTLEITEVNTSSVSRPVPTFTQENTLYEYSHKEEVANVITHGLGVFLGLLALYFMLLKGYQQQVGSINLFGLGIYGASIVLLFLASTLYHASRSELWRKRFKTADHCAIYTLIAGTYTPLLLLTLDTSKADGVLLAIWLLALGGIVFKTFFIGRFKAFSVILYLAMGWLCVAVMDELVNAMSTLGFNLLLGGGILYSLGVIFYVTKRIPYNHAIWHLFVLGGALAHFLCVYLTAM